MLVLFLLQPTFTAAGAFLRKNNFHEFVEPCKSEGLHIQNVKNILNLMYFLY
jgi:hypothetical protein